ncbi:MAG: hypothetical protein D6701_03965 [Gemmatimonadetes bacterium]|nr:MAG: hypothetical protein D6701_03965 [Gemmatimonadota bacterium]
MFLIAAACALSASLGGPGRATGQSAATALGDGRRAPAGVFSGAEGALSVPAVVLADPGVRVDGRLDEPAWAEAPLLTGFTQFDPSEGIPASQPTEVRVFVDDEAIYFGIRALDAEVGAVRATMAERDNVTRNDDYVRVILDTFHDSRRAYVFSVNPYGVQQDGIWLEGGRGNRRFGPPIDDNPDFIWESGARIESWGYAVEIRVPFKSLRFPRLPVQSWGLQITRRIQRSGYEQSWAPSFASQPNKLAEAGELAGLRNLDPGLFLEVNPALTARRIGELDDAGRFGRGGVNPDFGLNVTYGLTSNLTLDGTFNPDFSQVEADAGQIAINERFALFFPEKRPFFLEGTEIFGLPTQLVFTRTIANPIAGAKLTGKVGGLSLGYLGAIDERDGSDDVLVNLVRVRGDVGATSTLGAVYTDRTEAADVFNRVLGADARLVFRRRWTLELQTARSWDDDGGGLSAGQLLTARIARASRGLAFNAELEDIAPDFRAESGFIRRIGDTRAQGRLSYNWYGRPGAFVERVGPAFEFETFWDHETFWDGGRWKEGEARLQASLSLRNNFTLFLTASRGEFRSPAAAYEGLVSGPAENPRPFRPDPALFEGLYGLRVFFFASGLERVRGRVTLEASETPIFDRGLGVPVAPADQRSVDINLTLLPTTRLRADLSLRHESLYRKLDGALHSKATIPRLRAQFQFNRALFVRGIFEYRSQESGDLFDPGDGSAVALCGDDGCSVRTGVRSNEISVEGLISYEPSPGTVVFVGYTRRLEDGDAFRFRDVRTQADGLFAKVSYRFRR